MTSENGKEILNNPFLNKGTAFSMEERKQYHLIGLLPTAVRSLEEQADITYEKVEHYQTAYEKNRYMMQPERYIHRLTTRGSRSDS